MIPEGWERIPFSKVYTQLNLKNYQVNSSTYLKSGKTPIVDQGKKMVVGYSGQPGFSEVPVIIFGDHTRVVKFIDFEFLHGADGTKVFSNQKGFNIRFLYYLLCHARIPNLGYSRHMRELKECVFAIPPLAEQKRIAAILSACDAEIESLEKLTEARQEQKRGLMQQLLTGKLRVRV